MSEHTSDPRRIEHDLDQTRSRLDGHLTELQQRLSPGQVLDDVMRYFRGSEGADFGRSLLDSVRANPLPAALTGIGVAWLMTANPRGGAIGPSSAANGTGKARAYDRTSGPSQGSYDAMTTRLRTAEQGVSREHGEVDHAYNTRLDDARGHAVGIARTAQESGESFGKRIGDALASAQQAVVAGAHDLRDQAGSMAGSLGGAAQGAVQNIGDVAYHAGSAATQGGQKAGQVGSNLMAALAGNPALLGAIGVAAGALLGALLPQSDQEEAALGGIAGQARDTARSLAQGAVDQGGHVAQAVLDKGREGAEAHGLTGDKSPGDLLNAALSGDLASDAKQIASDVLRAGDEVVRKETLGQGEPAAK